VSREDAAAIELDAVSATEAADAVDPAA